MGLLFSKCCCGLDGEKDIQHFRPIPVPPQDFIGYWDPDPILLPPPLMSECYTPISERLQRDDLYWYERNVIVASKMAQKMDTEIDANLPPKVTN